MEVHTTDSQEVFETSDDKAILEIFKKQNSSCNLVLHKPLYITYSLITCVAVVHNLSI
jgi:hypothetical protein